MGSIIETLKVRRRVVGALLMREMSTRYGRENIGFLWLILEPILFTGSIILIRSLIAPHNKFGSTASDISLVTFLMTGYMPFMMFRHVASRLLNCIKENTNLFYHRRISVLDLYIARITIEVCGVVMAFIFASAFFITLGVMELPKDLFLVYAGWFYAIWFSIGFAFILAPLSELSRIVDRLYQPISYALVIVSGTFFMADWLPASIRDTVLRFNPMLHFFEAIRGGFFGDSVRVYYDFQFLTMVCALMTFFGLMLISVVRSKVVIE